MIEKLDYPHYAEKMFGGFFFWKHEVWDRHNCRIIPMTKIPQVVPDKCVLFLILRLHVPDFDILG